MQAGESLSFITIPDELSVSEVLPEIENEAAFDAFNGLMQAILTERAEWITSIEQPEQSGMVTVFEGSFQVSFVDGSYIHLVAFGHKNEGGYLDFGLSLAEHSENGRYLGGYMYEMDAADVRVSRLDTDDDSVELSEDEAHMHFSLLGMYAHTNELYETALTGDAEVRAYAGEQIQEFTEKTQLALMEKDLGMSQGYPTLDDIRKLEQLVALSSPFTAPR